MMAIGLTGGYATGKTEAAKMFKRNGAKIIYSDKIAHEVILPGTNVWKKILKYFGKEILLKNKKINRTKLVSIVFANKNKLKQLNRFVHPAVKMEIKRIIQKNKNNKILIFEIPLLFESHMENWFDKIIVVTNKEETQYKRVYKKNKIGKKDFMLRIKSQWPLYKKEGMADFVVDNSGSLVNTRKQVNKIWRILVRERT